MSVNIALPQLHEISEDKVNFCHYLLADPQLDQTEAYLKVSPDVKRASAQAQASKWMADPGVQKYLEKIFLERQKRLEIDEDWVIIKLREIHDRCMEAVPVWQGDRYEIDEESEEMVEKPPSYFKFDAAGALKSLELIGKHMRMFSDKVDASSLNLDISINFGAEEKKQPAIEGKFERVGRG